MLGLGLLIVNDDCQSCDAQGGSGLGLDFLV